MNKTLLKSYLFLFCFLTLSIQIFAQEVMVEVENICIESTEPSTLRKWKIVNVSSQLLSITANAGNNQNSSFNLAIGESKDLSYDTSLGKASSLELTANKNVVFYGDFPDPFICAPTTDDLPLAVNDSCSVNPLNNRLVWSLYNPNSVSIRVRYMLESSEGGLTKAVWVEAGKTIGVETHAKFGTNMVYTTSNGYHGCLQHQEEVCEISDVTLTNVCSNQRNKNRWRIENTNPFGFHAFIQLGDGDAKKTWIPAAGQGQNADGVAKSGDYKFVNTSNTITTVSLDYGNNQSIEANFFTGVCDDSKLDTLSCEVGKRSFLLSNAVSDSYHSGNHDHSIYLAGFNGGGAAKMTFDSDAYLVYGTDGKTAYIHGNATMTTGNLAGSKWVIYAPFEDKKENTGPKKELKSNAYDPNDGGVDTDSWFYFLMRDGAFMRQLDGDGYITMNTMPADGRYGLQIGKGANGKNVNTGASSWFFYCYNGQPAKQGDFNLDLADNCDDLSACSIFYIDNTTDLIYLVNPENDGDGGIFERNANEYNSISLQPYFTSPYRDAHMALNVEGTKLYLFESKGPNHNYGYFDLESKIFRPLGILNIEGGLVQASFNPYGQLYISSTSSNEIFVMDNPDVPNSQVSYGTIKIVGSNKSVNISGADMAFDKDGSFFLGTHGHGGAIFTVSGLANHLVARRVGTVNSQGKITGLAVMEAGGGSLLYSARDAEGMYMVHLDDPDNHEFLPFDSTFTKSAWGDMTTACMEPITACDGCYASEVVAFNQGVKADGSAIGEDRSNPSSALGQPQENDTYNFVSLGFGGSIELELPCPVYNHNKNGVLVGNTNSIDHINGDGYSMADFVIVETSFGKMNVTCGIDQNQNYPEKALVYGKESLSDDWVLLTPETVCRTSFIDIGPAVESGALDYVRYIKIEDHTDPAHHSGSADGYDVDGLIVCPDLVVGAITGEGRSGLVNARTADNKSVYALDFNRVNNVDNGEDVLTGLKVEVYPNPTTEIVSVQVNKLNRNINVRVFDNTGKLVFAKTAYESMNESINLSAFGKGMFVVQISSGGESITRKVLLK